MKARETRKINMVLTNGKHSVRNEGDEWFFSRNGWQATSIVITVKQFDMLKEMMNMPEIVEYYETKRIRSHPIRLNNPQLTRK